MDKIEETLGILQEECAEVIVEVSKIRRFGLDNISHHTSVSHKDTLAMEVGDMLTMVDILVEQGVLDWESVNTAKKNKRDKLHKWSNIFK